MAYTQLTSRSSPGAHIEAISRDSGAYRLSIPAGKADRYRLAQLDDYAKYSRRQFLHRPPLRLSLRARVSGSDLPGTWGFGLWNDPFGLSLGFGGQPWRLPALPNTAWFFGASPENHLSFSDGPGNGLLAQAFRAPRFHPLLILAGLALPFSRRTARRFVSRVVEEAAALLWSPAARRRVREQAPALQSFIPTSWHRYTLDWQANGVAFAVDEVPVFESSVNPRPPLGLVIWIDNQYAAFTPQGKIGFGVLENPEPAWLEISALELG